MNTPDTRTRWIRAIASTVLTAGVVGAVGPATAHAQPAGHLSAETGVGFFYGTFEDGENMTLLVGGSAEDFCAVGPTDDPGSAPSRVFFRADGSVDVKVNDKDQPTFLYRHAGPAGPDFLDVVCAPGSTVPGPFAVGATDLKLRVSDGGGGLVDVFNSVNGVLHGTDGSTYKVHASADLVLDDGVPVGDPSTFVDLSVREIGS